MNTERSERMKKMSEAVTEARRLKKIMDEKKDEESRKAFWDFVIKNGLGDNIREEDL